MLKIDTEWYVIVALQPTQTKFLFMRDASNRLEFPRRGWQLSDLPVGPEHAVERSGTSGRWKLLDRPC